MKRKVGYEYEADVEKQNIADEGILGMQQLTVGNEMDIDKASA